MTNWNSTNTGKRILVANIPLPANRFLVDLNASLERHVDLVHDHEAFWNLDGDYDAVQLHFPEYMTYEIENAYRITFTDKGVQGTCLQKDPRLVNEMMQNFLPDYKVTKIEAVWIDSVEEITLIDLLFS